MCIRYVGYDARQIRLEQRLDELRDRYRDVPMPGDRYPGDLGEFVGDGGEVQVGTWGLQPAWATDPAFGRRNAYNARAETVAQKPTFREAFRKRRCLVPASSFYERAGGRWLRVSPQQEPWFAVAGLFEEGLPQTNSSFTMVTTTPNLALVDVHDRMPVILSASGQAQWLDDDSSLEALTALLTPCPAEWIGVEDAGPVETRRRPRAPSLFDESSGFN